MNTKSKILLSLGFLAAPLALLAKSPESAYIESYHGRTGMPVPISVVTPDVKAEYAGTKVELEFVVDATGKPTMLTSITPGADSELVTSVLAAVAKWQFAPVVAADGKPVACKVVLPVVITDEFGSASRFAMN